MEAAQIARRVSPGLNRHFAFEQLLNFNASIWSDLRQTSRSQQAPPAFLRLYGYDQCRAAIQGAERNVRAAGLSESMSLHQADILTIEPPAHHGLLVTNPPYGIRSGEEAELAALYPHIGHRLKQYFHGWRAYFFTADSRLPKLIGLAAFRRTPLYNGDLECRFFEFKMVRGGNRKSARKGDHLTCTL